MKFAKIPTRKNTTVIMPPTVPNGFSLTMRRRTSTMNGRFFAPADAAAGVDLASAT
jgi:hypothetical protein